MRIAIVGNSPTHAGVTLAADMAMAGHDVRFARWTTAEVDFEAIRNNGGIAVQGEVRHLVAGRLGTGTPRLCDAPAEAVDGAELVMLDFAPPDLEQRLAAIAPHLSGDQVVHINTNSYWSACRAWPILRAAGRDDVVVTEVISPTVTADLLSATLTTKWQRQHLPAAALPAARSAFALERLRVISPTLHAAANVLETSFANLNMLAHPAIALLNIGWFDRAAQAAEDIHFWMDGATANAALLAEAADEERRKVCEAYGVRWLSTAAHLGATYGGTATAFVQAIRECAFYQGLPRRSPQMWRRWLGNDVPLAHVPFVEAARLAGITTPIHDAYITTFGALLGQDFRSTGLTLEKLQLARCDKGRLQHYVQTGAA